MDERTTNQIIKLVTIGTLEDQCVPGNAIELSEFITNHFGAASQSFVNQVVYGSQTPTQDQRQFLWFRKDTNGNPMGIFYYNGNEDEWLPFPQVLPDAINGNERKYFRFDVTRNLEDMPIGWELDPDPLIQTFRRLTDQGVLKYAFIKLIGSKY